MPAALEPLRRFKCTYETCFESFDTEKAMKSHKKYDDDHDYCHKCDQDFEDYEAFAYHKIIRPKEHDKACRVCGDEFKSEAGLKRHIELNHKIDQKLVCIGCSQSFHRACLLIEHLEFGYCKVITPTQFHGHIVHKHLITDYLKGGEAYARFQQKQAKFEATLDHEEDGGVNLDDEIFDDDKIDEVSFKAIEPEEVPNTPLSPATAGPYPPLPSKGRNNSVLSSDLASNFDGISLDDGDSGASTVVNSPVLAPTMTSYRESPSTASVCQVSSTQGSTVSRNRTPKVWGSRNGKSSTTVLFPGAKATPVPSEFSIAAYDNNVEQEHGLNIMKTRFWDPNSSDFNAERFYNAIIHKYYCPFICEQNFPTASDLHHHINCDHRITRMKCPTCLKYFKSATALIAHCESRGAKCEINKADDYNIFLDRISGGFLGVQEKIRPDHLNNPSVLLPNKEGDHMEVYSPPVARYLQYVVTKPPDWKEPVGVKVVGGSQGRQHASPW